MCCGGLYSLYRGIRNIKHIGNWQGKVLFYGGLGLFTFGAYILISLTRKVPEDFLYSSDELRVIVVHYEAT